MNIILLLLGAWSGIAMFVCLVADEFWEVMAFGSPLALVTWPWRWIEQWGERREWARERAVQQINDDYNEVVRMIEWKYTEPTPLQALQDELEVERLLFE